MIGAPLTPMAVIAGAGSGKSETMAARLVWLVANRLVRPERVLGLTFTRKAAAELGERVRTRLDRLHRAGLAGTRDDEQPGEPAVSTYHAYAGRLVSDHALRDGLEPSLRLVTPAVSWQIAARVVAAYDGPMDAISWTPAIVTAAVIDLAGELAEHLRGAADVRAVGEWLHRGLAELPGKVPGRHPPGAGHPADPRAAAAAGGRLPRGQDGPRGHRLRRPDGHRRADRRPPPGGRRGRAQPVPGRPARRVPGHQPRPARPAARAVQRGTPGHRGRRPVPVDLRVARRQRGQPAPLPGRLPRARGAPGPGADAVDQLPQHRPRAERGRRPPGRAARGRPRGAAARRPARPR